MLCVCVYIYIYIYQRPQYVNIYMLLKPICLGSTMKHSIHYSYEQYAD